MVDNHFCSSKSSICSGVLIIRVDPKITSHIYSDTIELRDVAVCKLHLNPNGWSWQLLSGCIYSKHCPCPRLWAFSKENFENYWSATRRYLKIPTPCSWDQQCTQGLYGHCQHCHILAHRHQTWYAHTSLIWYLLMSPESGHITAKAVSECFITLLQG